MIEWQLSKRISNMAHVPIGEKQCISTWREGKQVRRGDQVDQCREILGGGQAKRTSGVLGHANREG